MQYTTVFTQWGKEEGGLGVGVGLRRGFKVLAREISVFLRTGSCCDYLTSCAISDTMYCRLEISIEVNSWPALFQVPASPRRATRSSSTWRARVTWPWTAVNATRLAGTCHAHAQRSGPPDSLSLFYFCQIDSSIALFLMQCCFHHWKKCPSKPIGLQKGRVGKKPSALPPPLLSTVQRMQAGPECQ